MNNYTNIVPQSQEFSKMTKQDKFTPGSHAIIAGAITVNPGKAAQMPWPASQGKTIYPVFLPFLGCPSRCVFCSQERQTGASADKTAFADSLARAMDDLEIRHKKGKRPCELAFYGGTFTALPDQLMDLCLMLARRAREKDLITSFRCSTRPDTIANARLADMLTAGLSLVELGIQSFSEKALAASGRHCSASDCIQACALLKQNGIKFGVQLMPGMPGGNLQSFLSDVRLAIALGASLLRFYPCLVLENTALAVHWRKKAYAPWSLRKAIHACALGKLIAQAANCDVIRLGVAHQAGLETTILAGPFHSDFGGRALGLALLLAAVQLKHAGRPGNRFVLTLPARCQGHYLGWRNEYAKAWKNLGVIRFKWTDRAWIELNAG